MFKYDKIDHPVYKYVLQETYQIKLPDLSPLHGFKHEYFSFDCHSHILTVKESYCWDGASGIAIDSENFMRGSLVHDVLFQAMREGLLHSRFFDASNRILQRICTEDGMIRFRSWYVYKAVSLFGKKYARK